MSDLIRDNLKEIVNLQDMIKTDKLHYKSKHRKVYNFNEYCFLRDIHEEYLSLKDADDEERSFAAKIKNLDKGKTAIEK